MLGKDVTLNFNNMGPVVQYIFNRFWTYDGSSKILTEVTSRVANGCGNNSAYTFSTNYGGVIISDATLAYAMGVYGVSIPRPVL